MNAIKRRQPTQTAAEQLERIRQILRIPAKSTAAPVIGPTKAPKHFAEVERDPQ
jgi:hypothetical protein